MKLLIGFLKCFLTEIEKVNFQWIHVFNNNHDKFLFVPHELFTNINLDRKGDSKAIEKIKGQFWKM